MSNEAKTILIVEDDRDIQELMRYNLEMAGYQVRSAYRGDDALKELDEALPQLVILDLMLPGIDGLDVLKGIRFDRGLKHLPVIIASAKSEESDVITGLELGADDYLPKPFSPKILTARVKALLRRADKPQADAGSDQGFSTKAGLSMDPIRFTCTLADAPISLTATEFSLLYLLANEGGRVFTRNQMISSVKGSDYPVTERSIDVQIATLRKKLGNCGEFIRTVWGVGYKYQEGDN